MGAMLTCRIADSVDLGFVGEHWKGVLPGWNLPSGVMIRQRFPPEMQNLIRRVLDRAEDNAGKIRFERLMIEKALRSRGVADSAIRSVWADMSELMVFNPSRWVVLQFDSDEIPDLPEWIVDQQPDAELSSASTEQTVPIKSGASFSWKRPSTSFTRPGLPTTDGFVQLLSDPDAVSFVPDARWLGDWPGLGLTSLRANAGVHSDAAMGCYGRLGIIESGASKKLLDVFGHKDGGKVKSGLDASDDPLHSEKTVQIMLGLGRSDNGNIESVFSAVAPALQVVTIFSLERTPPNIRLPKSGGGGGKSGGGGDKNLDALLDTIWWAVDELSTPNDRMGGAVLLIEETVKKHIDGMERLVPPETFPLGWFAIYYAFLAGVTVIQAAGNSDFSLNGLLNNQFTNAQGRSDFVGYGNTGSILVTGATPPPDAGGNFAKDQMCMCGDRIDCFSWSSGVYTWSILDDEWHEYKYTSCASAIIAGAAVVLQSLAFQLDQTFLEPEALRLALILPNIVSVHKVQGSMGVHQDLPNAVQPYLPDCWASGLKGPTQALMDVSDAARDFESVEEASADEGWPTEQVEYLMDVFGIDDQTVFYLAKDERVIWVAKDRARLNPPPPPPRLGRLDPRGFFEDDIFESYLGRDIKLLIVDADRFVQEFSTDWQQWPQTDDVARLTRRTHTIARALSVPQESLMAAIVSPAAIRGLQSFNRRRAPPTSRNGRIVIR